jgi:hypothetical protein
VTSLIIDSYSEGSACLWLEEPSLGRFKRRPSSDALFSKARFALNESDISPNPNSSETRGDTGWAMVSAYLINVLDVMRVWICFTAVFWRQYKSYHVGTR